jgi:N-acetylneuraminic acid mutarotase
MRYRSRKPLRSNTVLTLLGTFLILIVSAASDALAAGTWSLAGSRTVASFFPSVTVLTDGRVLVAGGCGSFLDDNCPTVLATAELFNPATGTWSATGSMSVARVDHTATRLLDGRVLVASGCGPSGFGACDLAQIRTSAELYNPATGTWSPTGSTSVGSFGFIATRLLDGRVLIAGGGPNSTSAELYDPTTGTWSPTGSTSVSRINGTATRLRDGRVLVLGGGPNGTSAELYDPATGTWSVTGSTSACCFGGATLLMDGTVLVTGGPNGTSAELYDPTTGTWSATGSTSACCFGGPTLLMDGTVLVTGGGPNSTSAELYDPTTGTWSATGSTSVSFSAARLLLDGRVLATGGGGDGGPDGTSAELFNPSPPGPLFAAVLPTSRSVAVGTPATAFATIINTGTSTATGCQIAAGTILPASFAFQTTDPSTNAVTGTVNTPVNVPAKAAQTFVFAFTPTAAIPATDVPLNFFCANAAAAPIVSGIDTLLLSASTTAGPDIVALAATLNNDGIVDIPGVPGIGIFSVATMNLGADGTITVSADMGAADLPVRITLCQTDPMTAQCVTPMAPSANPVVTVISANATPTFGIFVTGTSTVAFAPELNRIFVRFTDAGGVPRGSTSVAVRTQ